MADIALGTSSRTFSCKDLFPASCSRFLILDEVEGYTECLADSLSCQPEWHWCWRHSFNHDCRGTKFAKPPLVLLEKLSPRLSGLV